MKLDQMFHPFNSSNNESNGKRLNLDEFAKKYESQRIKWERLKNSPAVDHKFEEEQKELEGATFKPEINTRSKRMVRDLEKIENRVKVLNEGREKKIRELQEAAHTQYPFKPMLNKKSEMLSKKRETTSTSPIGVRSNQKYNEIVNKSIVPYEARQK